MASGSEWNLWVRLAGGVCVCGIYGCGWQEVCVCVCGIYGCLWLVGVCKVVYRFNSSCYLSLLLLYPK